MGGILFCWELSYHNVEGVTPGSRTDTGSGPLLYPLHRINPGRSNWEAVIRISWMKPQGSVTFELDGMEINVQIVGQWEPGHCWDLQIFENVENHTIGLYPVRFFFKTA